jgi:putative transposase
LFFDGLSVEDVRRNLGQILDHAPSTATVYEWIRDYSNLAETRMRNSKPTKLGNTWVADEMVVRAGGQKVWIWTVMDAETRFILASYVSLSRRGTDALKLFREAKRTANGDVPTTLITDGLPAYRKAATNVFGQGIKHEVAGSIALSPNNNLIERLNGTIRERTKVMRCMKSRHSTEELLEGWTVHYNYFRPHESLDDHPPAVAAGAKYTLKNWEDVAREDVRPISGYRSHTERKRAATERRMTAARLTGEPKLSPRRRDLFGGEKLRRGLIGGPTSTGFVEGKRRRMRKLFT